MPKPSEIFGKRLEVALEGRSQTWLAREAETTPAMINGYINGKGTPNIKTAERIAEALGVSLASLVDTGPIVAQPKVPTIEEARLAVIAFILKAHPKAVEHLQKTIKGMETPVEKKKDKSDVG